MATAALSFDSLPQDLANSFGNEAFGGDPPPPPSQVIGMILPLLREDLAMRYRTLLTGIVEDPWFTWVDDAWYDGVKTRRDRINKEIHWPSFQGYLFMLRALHVPSIGDDFRDEMTELYEALFRIRVGEASRIISRALEEDPASNDEDKRTDEAKRFSWIIRVINGFTGWKNDMSYNVRLIMRETRPTMEYLARRENMAAVANCYEAFLDSSLLLIDDAGVLPAWRATVNRLWLSVVTHQIGRDPRFTQVTTRAIQTADTVFVNVLSQHWRDAPPITPHVGTLPPPMPHVYPRSRVADHFRILQRDIPPRLFFNGYVNDNKMIYDPNDPNGPGWRIAPFSYQFNTSHGNGVPSGT
ncbi:hypothetical protein F4810DRAFT_44499 [Camillea tinctor]|nr:hypothetical protein F4810DRAFT_44499 [Camillea tinctor]